MRPVHRPHASTKAAPPAKVEGRASADVEGGAGAGTPDGSAPATTPGAPKDAFGHKPPKPIGPAALKALREAIRSGKYPSDDAVRSGLERLIRKPE